MLHDGLVDSGDAVLASLAPRRAEKSAPAIVIEVVPKALRNSTAAVTPSGQMQAAFKGTIMIVDDTLYMLDAVGMVFEFEG